MVEQSFQGLKREHFRDVKIEALNTLADFRLGR